MTARLDVTREQVLAFRRRAGSLDMRLPAGADALCHAAWAGLKDSMPRAALLSLHARVSGVGAAAWEDPALVQLWGPGHHAYVVPRADIAVFTLGLHPEGGAARERADSLAAALAGLLGNSRRMPYGEAGAALGVPPNRLRYAATTGTVLLRWDGARQPVIWTVPPPDVDPADARRELARRYLHLFGPTVPSSFGHWSGLGPREAAATFTALGTELIPVRSPLGEAWIRAEDEDVARATPPPTAGVRLLPSGDAYFLLHGQDRELLVPDAHRRALLWTTRVWPGALLVDGEIAGVWRRSDEVLTVQPWDALSENARRAVETEAAGLPLPGLRSPISVRWESD